MIIPLVVMQLGIFMDYWGDFLDNAWSVHIHYITGTIWYIYLIIQPYYATHGKMEKHRTNGIIGIFLAGGVCLTALSMLRRDVENSLYALANPDRMGPFEPWFFYGVAVVEIFMMTAFGFAIIMSIVHRKNLEDHSWWLISTVFLIMMPALGRGLQNVYILMKIDDWPKIDIMIPIYISQVVILGMLLLAAKKYNKLVHPATYLAIAINILVCFMEPIAKIEGLDSFLNKIIK